MSSVVFILEEESMAAFLKSIEPAVRDLLGLQRRRLLYHPLHGKGNLKKKCSRVIEGHMAESADRLFLILCDQDDEDCVVLKDEFSRIVKQQGATGRCRVRIVCKALEAWLLGDKDAFKAAFPNSNIGKNTHRNPDSVPNPKGLVQRAARSTAAPQIAQQVGSKMSVESIRNNKSRSFQNFVAGLDRLCRKHQEPK